MPDSIAGRALCGDLAGAMRPIQVVNQELQGLGCAVIPSTDIVKNDVE
jgi:hypothetical protein